MSWLPLAAAGLPLGFDAPHLLLWLLAVAVPLVLAWWARRRLPSLAFGGFRLLRLAAGRAAARPRGGRWWMTWLRMLLLAAAVLAAAGPAFRPVGPAAGLPGVSGNVWVVAAGGPGLSAAGSAGSAKAVTAALAAADLKQESLTLRTDVELAEAARKARPGDVIAICDGLVPTPSQAQRLWRWVEAGGAAVALLGPESLAEPDWPSWSESLADRTGVSLLPVKDAQDDGLMAAADLLPTAVGPMSREGLISIPGPTVNRLLQLVLPAPQTELKILASARRSASPVVVCKPLGRGAVTVSALPLRLDAAKQFDRDEVASRWSDLPAWPVFPAFVRGLLEATVHQCQSASADRAVPWSEGLLAGGLIAVAFLALAVDAANTTAGWPSNPGRLLAAVLLTALAWHLLWPTGQPRSRAEPPALLGTEPPVRRLPGITAELPPLCWPGEQVEIAVSFAGPLPVPVRVTLDGPGGRLAKTELSPAAGDPRAGGGPPACSLLWQPAETLPPGRCQLRLQCLPLVGGEPGAGAWQEESLSLATTIADRPARLLLVDAEPRFACRFAKRAVAGDRRFAVTARLLATAAQSPPIDWSAYDAVWLGDCLGLLPDDQAAATRTLPTEALTAIGRQLATGRLGVAWTPGERFRQGGFVVGEAGGWLPVTAAAPLSPPLRSGEGLGLWPRPSGIASGWLPADRSPLGPVYSLLEPVSLRPTTVMLATAFDESAAAVPAVVLGRYGKGTVVGHLCETWRWRAEQLADGRNLHEVYWRQTLCRLATLPLLRRLGAAETALEWPLRFVGKPPITSSPQISAAGGRRRPGTLVSQLLIAALVASCTVAWWPSGWSGKGAV